MVERHVGEGVSEKISVNFAVGGRAVVGFGVGVLSIVGIFAELWVVVAWSEWEGQVSENINVLH